MELLQPLSDYTRNRKLTELEIIKLGQDLCTALDLCSRKGIIHRDIKPGNIFVSSFGDFKLGDFGIARELDKASASMSTRIGTPAYMAPEIAIGKRYDNTVDIYSLGIVLYRFLNYNRLPFIDLRSTEITYKDQENAILRRHGGEQLPAPAEASWQTANVILTACQYDPAMRYRSAAEFKSALENVGNPPPPPPPDGPMISCTSCGAKNEKGDLFCFACGKSMEEKSNTPKVPIITGIVCICVIALVVLLIQFLNRSSEPQPSPPPTASPTAAPSPVQTTQTEPPPAPGSIEAQSVNIIHEGTQKSNVQLNIGEIITLNVVIEPSNADVDIVWTSSDTGIFDFIVIDTSGTSATLVGILSGDATLSVRAGNIVQTCTISILSPTLIPDAFSQPRLHSLHNALQNLDDNIFIRFHWTDGPQSGRTSDLEWLPHNSQWWMYGATGNNREVFPEFIFNGGAMQVFWPRAPRRSYYLYENGTGYFAEADGSDSENFVWEIWVNY
jgi:serine/threonine protein kinase